MALGMRRAVFSLVIEQMSFNRTVSWKYTHTHTHIQLYTHTCTHSHVSSILLIKLHRRAKNYSPYQCFPAEDVAIKTDPVLGEVESSLQEDVPLKGTWVVCNRNETKKSKLLWSNIIMCYKNTSINIKLALGMHIVLCFMLRFKLRSHMICQCSEGALRISFGNDYAKF